MAYVKKTWVDRVVEYPSRYTDELSDVKTFTPNPGIITAEGDPVNAVNLNHMEQGIFDKADVIEYTATIPYTSWTGSVAPFTKVVTVTGILATDKPIVDIVLTGTYATDLILTENWGLVYRITTSANNITVYANEVPSANIPIILKVVK